MKSVALESGSFRDRDNQVFYADGRVYRGLAKKAGEDFAALAEKPFFKAAQENGRIVKTSVVEKSQTLSGEASPDVVGHWDSVLEHQRIPFISYPYEWSFSMLKDASILQLELLIEALKCGMILKDATPYNVQWVGGQPVFIDTTSFEIMKPGQVWYGYKQFCEQCLYPLMLQSYHGVSFQNFLRGNIEGLPVDEFNRLLSMRDMLRPGVFKHVFLHSKLSRSYAGTTENLHEKVKESGFHIELILANVRSLLKLVKSLRWTVGETEWSDYADSCVSYEKADADKKQEIVNGLLGRSRYGLTWDLGCNTGVFSRMAARYSDYVLGLDSDPLAVERMYLSLKNGGEKNILPMVGNIAQLSPGLGWRGRERKRLEERGKPDMIMALALIHHVVISANIPITQFVDWLSESGRQLIIEFVDRKDPMVKKLLSNRLDQYDDYYQDKFEEILGKAFTIESKETLPSGNRTMYLATSKR